MNTKNFFIGRTVGFIILAVLFVAGYFIASRFLITKDSASETLTNEATVSKETAETTPAPEGKPRFTWIYNYKPDGDYPETDLSLTATYENGATVTKVIDTAQGSCNQYDTRDRDVYAQSEMVICYFAGLGHYYKVVESKGEYLVQRRIFEEGSPDYNPPVLPFETIAQF